MDFKQVYQQFCQFAGLDTQQAREWEGLCKAAAAKLSGMLVPNAPLNDSRLILAAAGEAYYQYALAHSGTDAKSVKIGDVSVSSQSGTGAESARILRDELLAGISEFLEPAAGLRRVL